MTGGQHKIGIISDTHGVLPGEVHQLFKDVDQIIHAGDIGHEDILIELQTLAPVAAVYGNVDRQPLRAKTRERFEFSMGDYKIIVAHFPLYFGDEKTPTIRISGHTHKPLVLQRRGSLLINPGSAAFPRGEYKPSVALLTIAEAGARAEIVYF